MTEVADGVGIGAAAQDAEEKCPKCGRAKHDTKYRRNRKARQQALKRDAAKDPCSLSPRAQAFVKKFNGTRVPKGYAVHHKEPLYTRPYSDRCQLDTEGNMETIRKSDHRRLHKIGGDTYKEFPLRNYRF